MLEIHIDIGWFTAIPGNKAFEQQFHARRINLGDAQAVAHSRVGGGAPALAQDALAAGKGDDVLNSEEVVFVLHFRDQCQFLANQPLNLQRCACGVTPAFALPGEPLQVGCW